MVRSKLTGARVSYVGERELESLRRLAIRLQATDLWRAYLPGEPMELRFRPLKWYGCLTYWSGRKWVVTFAEDLQDWRGMLLHEIAHLLKRDAVRVIPWEVLREGEISEDLVTAERERLSAPAQLGLASQEAAADAFAARERSKW